IDAITDINVLRSYLRDTTESLHSAAQMGLDLAQQNQALQQRLDEMALDQEELKQRLLMVERDRQWFQQQSLRVDQMRAALGELQVRTEKNSRRMASEQRVATLEKTLERLRDDMEGLARNMEETGGFNRPAVGLKTVANTVRELSVAVADLQQAMEQVADRVDQNDVRARGTADEVSRQLVGLRKRVDGLQDVGQEAQAAAMAVASRQDDLEASLKSVIHEYNDMLNEHEQTLRILGDAQSVLESQVAQRQPPRYSLHRAMSPSSSGSSFAQNSIAAAAAAAPQPLVAAAGYGESLGDIFADDAVGGACGKDIGDNRSAAASAPVATAVDVAESFLPSPPLSTMSSGHPAPPMLTGMAHTRKAASVIGTPGDRPKQRTRPRMSSFSKISAQNNNATVGFRALSPTKLSDFGNILSATAHVGVGWGNYWQARRD
ncbi:hypothetical protein LPJ75_005734, partial [Coemansia sp. RSA 2598]